VHEILRVEKIFCEIFSTLKLPLLRQRPIRQSLTQQSTHQCQANQPIANMDKDVFPAASLKQSINPNQWKHKKQRRQNTV
jgi:hypothetical protein